MTVTIERVWQDFNLQLKRFIYSRIKDDDISNDILQDVYIKIHEKIHELKDSDKLQSWVYQITRNTVIDYLRKKKDLSLDSENFDIPDEVNAEIGEKRLNESLKKMIAGLPLIYREVLVLTEYKNMSHKQIAEKLNLSIPAVKSRVLRAKEKLKELLLECCHFELDSYNIIIDYHPKCSCCSGSSSKGDCCS